MVTSMLAGSSMADALDEALAHVEKPLPKETNISSMRLCGWKTDNLAPDKLTVPAMIGRQQGVIIMGPRLEQHSSIGSRFELIQATEVVHWALDPVRRGGKGRKTFTRPSISPTHLVRTTCSKCGKTEDIWWDNLFRRHADQRKDLMITLPSFVAYVESQKGKGHNKRTRSGAPPLVCDACALAKHQILLHQKHLPTSLLPAGLSRREVNSVCEGIDDPIIADMEAAWRGEIPTKPDDTFLPRIWAGYERGHAPTDLPPHDARGLMIEDRIRYKAESEGKTVFTIRPARVAFEIREPAPKNFMMEACSTIQWGWVAESELFGQTELGYKRKFLTPKNVRSRQYETV